MYITCINSRVWLFKFFRRESTLKLLFSQLGISWLILAFIPSVPWTYQQNDILGSKQDWKTITQGIRCPVPQISLWDAAYLTFIKAHTKLKVQLFPGKAKLISQMQSLPGVGWFCHTHRADTVVELTASTVQDSAQLHHIQSPIPPEHLWYQE